MQSKRLQQIRNRWSQQLDESRIRLARPDALVPLALLGLLTGLLAGGVIVLFRLFVEGVQEGNHYGPVAVGAPDEGARDECRRYE